jgi:hypothetical protein
MMLVGSEKRPGPWEVRIPMILKKYPFIVWAVLLWAMVMGCFVFDFHACPWTAVFL